MTERERWIVYPLLFLALGTSLRGKLGLAEDTTITKQLEVTGVPGDRPELVIKDGTIFAKKLIVGELIAETPIKKLDCENLTVKNQLRAKQQVANEFVLVDHENERRVLARLFKDSKSGSGTFYLVNEAGLPIVGMRSTNNNVGRIELWQQTTGNLAQIRQAINADGKPGEWDTYPLLKPKPEPKKKTDDANKAEKKSDDATSKDVPDEIEPPAKETEE